jgi:hypothetical protein
MRRWGTAATIWAAAGSAAALCVLAVLLFGHAIASALVANGASAFTGTNVSFSSMRLSANELVLHDVKITSRNGEPIAQIALVDVRYHLAHVLGGGARKYGLRSITIDKPKLTIIRHRDGTLNIPIPTSRPTGPSKGPPFVFTLRVRHGLISFAGKPSMHGSIRIPAMNLDAFALRNEPGVQHFAGRILLRDGIVQIAGLTRPVSGMHGDFDITDNAVTTTGLFGRIGHLGVRIGGGMYSLKTPQMRLALRGRAPLAEFRSLAQAAARFPMNGTVAFRVMVEGPALAPAAFLSIDAPHLAYNGVSLTGTRVLAAADAREFDILRMQTHQGALALGAAGRLAYARGRDQLRMLLTGDAPAGSLPFAGNVAPGMPLRGAVLASASDLRHIRTRGVVSGATATQQAFAFFHVAAPGTGTVGPVFIGNRTGSAYARIEIDHAHGRIAALVDARNFRIVPAPPVELGRFRISPLPTSMSGVLNGSVAGIDRGSRVVAQIHNGAFTMSNGLQAVRALDAVVGFRPGVLDVYSARARVAGGDALAAGSIGNGATLSLALNGSRVRHVTFGGAMTLALGKNGYLAIRHAVLSAGPATIGIRGGVYGVRMGAAPSRLRYDIATDVDDLDLAQAASIASPRFANEIAGSMDADFRVTGTGTQPSIAGTIDVPEGSVYGQAFRDLRVRVNGNASQIALDAGSVTFGETDIALNGRLARTALQVSLRAPHADLDDFNDFFDTGDTLAGRGPIDANFSVGSALRTSGSVALRGARFRQFDFGTMRAQWYTTGDAVLHLNAQTASSDARLRIAGSVAVLPAESPATLLAAVRRSRLDLSAGARDVSLAAWLPIFGLTVPITGTANADATVSGTYPALDVAATAAVRNATAGRVPIQSASAAMRMKGMRGTIERARLEMPDLSATASGSFGLATSSPIDLTAHAATPNLGALAAVVTGVRRPLSGAVATDAHVTGTPQNPRVDDRFTLTSLRYANFAVPRVSGELGVNERSAALRNVVADFAHGRLLASARLPIDAKTHRLGPRSAPISARVTANRLSLANFAGVLPKGSRLGGSIDGSLTIGGNVGAPQLGGTMQLANGSYTGPLDKDTLDGIAARLAFVGTTATLQSLHVDAGGGTLSGSGRVLIPDLSNPAAAKLGVHLVATHARVDSPSYFNGQIDANVLAAYAPTDPLTIGGNVTVSHARIPVSALYHPSASQSPPPPPNVGFHNLGIRVGPDVRVQSGNVDVGAAGGMTLNGTLAAPQLAGTFRSTGGTLNFYHVFRILRGSATFAPSTGIMPFVNAVATTSIPNPPTDIRIHVSGPATNMNLGLTSNPQYDRSQILGLLVGAQTFGAVQGVPKTSSTGAFSASSVIQSVGFSQANQIFTRSILEPAATSLGSALGISNLQFYNNVGSGYGSGFGAMALKRLTQDLTLSTSENFGIPRRSVVQLRYARKNVSDVAFRVYQQQQTAFITTPTQLLPVGQSAFNTPAYAQFIGTGSSGYSLIYQRSYP